MNARRRRLWTLVAGVRLRAGSSLRGHPGFHVDRAALAPAAPGPCASVPLIFILALLF